MENLLDVFYKYGLLETIGSQIEHTNLDNIKTQSDLSERIFSISEKELCQKLIENFGDMGICNFSNPTYNQMSEEQNANFLKKFPFYVSNDDVCLWNLDEKIYGPNRDDWNVLKGNSKYNPMVFFANVGCSVVTEQVILFGKIFFDDEDGAPLHLDYHPNWSMVPKKYQKIILEKLIDILGGMEWLL